MFTTTWLSWKISKVISVKHEDHPNGTAHDLPTLAAHDLRGVNNTAHATMAFTRARLEARLLEALRLDKAEHCREDRLGAHIPTGGVTAKKGRKSTECLRQLLHPKVFK